jgi:hypothetical protein
MVTGVAGSETAATQHYSARKTTVFRHAGPQRTPPPWPKAPDSAATALKDVTPPPAFNRPPHAPVAAGDITNR